MGQYLQAHGVPRNVSDKDQAGTVENLLSIDLDLHCLEFILPERSPDRPEVIGMVDVSGPLLTYPFDHCAVESETGNRSKALAVRISQIQGPDESGLERSYDGFQFLVKAQLVCEQIFRSVGYNQQRFVAAFKAVADFPNRAVPAYTDYHRAIKINRGVGSQLTRMFERPGQTCFDLESPFDQVSLELPARPLAAGGAGFGIQDIHNVTIVRFHI
jgi:hypothetical protein